MQSVDLLRNYASLLLDTQGYVRNLTKFLILSVVLFLQLRGRRPKSLRELEIKLRETKLNSSLFFYSFQVVVHWFFLQPPSVQFWCKGCGGFDKDVRSRLTSRVIPSTALANHIAKRSAL